MPLVDLPPGERKLREALRPLHDGEGKDEKWERDPPLGGDEVLLVDYSI